MDVKKVCVDTPLGKLCACVGEDQVNYPAIFVYIERLDRTEIDLVSAEVKPDLECVKAYLYGDTSTDQWTRNYRWSKEEINIECP